jgi:GNAT superfamily N-acetyltransferase
MADGRPRSGDDPVRIRPAREEDLPVLREIEVAAGGPFRDIGMAEVADDEPPSVEALDRHRRLGLCWVAVDAEDDDAADGADLPIAYLIAEPVDGNLHVEQVSVHPRWARRRIGQRLIEVLAERAVAGGVPALTLTTFADVPWNGPYYARCGFRALADEELTPGLRAIRAREAAHGLDRWPRVCMRRDL